VMVRGLRGVGETRGRARAVGEGVFGLPDSIGFPFSGPFHPGIISNGRGVGAVGRERLRNGLTIRGNERGGGDLC